MLTDAMLWINATILTENTVSRVVHSELCIMVSIIILCKFAHLIQHAQQHVLDWLTI